MADSSPTVVAYLYWGPAGEAPFERFVASWQEHPPGAAHRLVILRKELSGAQADRCAQVTRALSADPLTVEGGLDLASYREAAAAIEASTLCFLNTASEILADGWLGTMLRTLAAPGVGLVGASGSHESLLDWTPAPLRPLRRNWFPPFPNPHIRTSGFVLDRRLMLDLRWPRITRKSRAWRLENGHESITRQVEARGLEARVVGRDGASYPPPDWKQSHTFRSGEQENLLIADNRTREYADADPARRAELTRAAWGD